MELTLKAVLGAGLMVAFTLLGRSGKGELAGLLALFPLFSIPGYWIVASSGSPEDMREAVRASVIAYPVLGGFFAATWLGLSYFSWQLSILFGLGIWLILALIWSRWIL